MGALPSLELSPINVINIESPCLVNIKKPTEPLLVLKVTKYSFYIPFTVVRNKVWIQERLINARVLCIFHHNC